MTEFWMSGWAKMIRVFIFVLKNLASSGIYLINNLIKTAKNLKEFLEPDGSKFKI